MDDGASQGALVHKGQERVLFKLGAPESCLTI